MIFLFIGFIGIQLLAVMVGLLEYRDGSWARPPAITPLGSLLFGFYIGFYTCFYAPKFADKVWGVLTYEIWRPKPISEEQILVAIRALDGKEARNRDGV